MDVGVKSQLIQMMDASTVEPRSSPPQRMLLARVEVIIVSWRRVWLFDTRKGYDLITLVVLRVDEDGFIYLTGRVKDYFKTIQGKFVAPPPIEGEFAKNPNAEQQCLLGRGYSKTVMVAVLTEEAQSRDDAEVEQSLLETVTTINAEVEKHARIGAVIVSREAWSIENEVLTPTLKIKREKVEERFGELAEKLARESAEQGALLIRWG